jgi:rod shape determining protein RodA
LYGATLVLLVLVLIVGAVRGGARLSFDLGFFSVQPAEMAKVTTLLMLAGYLSDDRLDYVPYDTFINALLIMVAPSVLILLQPDLGSASVLVACAMGVLLVAGVRIKYIVMISLFALISGVVAILSGLVRGYQLDRFKAFINQNSDDDALQNIIFQVKNAKRAVASGGLFGKGYLQGPLTNGSFIPVQKTDFVFSAIAEQFGLIGSGMVLTLFGVILWRIWRTAQMTRSQLGRFICIGAFTMILWQVFQNIGMTLGIMPVTGFALPYVSYGGSHIVAGAVLIGLVQNVHMRRLR